MIAMNSEGQMPIPNKFNEERQDIIFRRVRGILNKITPETFDKLSKELVNVGLDSPRTLRGVIYLLFDKALKDLKYSSLYAKLCQELSERSPNFEQEPGPNTFCKFLISKCEDEFERRRKATEDFDSKNELTDEEFEQQIIAKQKMLGNIKFICELGKKRLLQEEILHECIRGLLSKKKERPLQDQAQDLECLCQIMRTIGSLLDVQASKNLMNQYFERIDMFSKKPDLPSRIRFMLRDVIDLRNNNWRPRPFQKEDNVPQPLSKLREEAGYDASMGSSIDKFGNNKNLLGMGNLSNLHGSKLSALLVNDEPGFTTTTDFHWGPTYLPDDPAFDMFASGIPFNKSDTKPANSRFNAPAATVLSNQVNPINIAHGNQKSSQPQNIMTNYPQTRSLDPFADSTKVRFNHNRVTALNSTGPPGHPNNTIDTKRFNGANLGKGQQYSDMNEHDFDAVGYRHNHTRDSGFVPHYRDNNNIPSANVNTKIPDTRADHVYSGPRRFDQPRVLAPLPHPGGNIPPSLQGFNQSRRHPQDVLPPQKQAPVHMSHPPPQNSPPTQIAHRNPRFEQRNSNGPDRFDRERRFNRGPDHFVHEPRQPRFSGANYRLPGRDRPPTRDHQQLERATYQREAELNSDWRSACLQSSSKSANVDGPNSDTTISSSNRSSQEPNLIPHKSTELNLDAPMNHKRIPDTTQSSESNFKLDNAPIETKQPIFTRNQPVDQIQGHMADMQGDSLRSYGKSNSGVSANSGPNQQQNQWRTDENPRESQLARKGFNDSPNNQQPANRQAVRRNDIRPPATLPPSYQSYKPASPRTGGPGVHQDRVNRDRIERDRRPMGVQQEFERSPLKGSEHESNFSFERNYRPPVGRNQPSDGPHGVTERNRGPNWRREAPTSLASNQSKPNVGNSSTASREHPATTISAINTPNIPKPPAKISDSSFSLRPSHNLIGRTLSATPATPKQPVLNNSLEPVADTKTNGIFNNTNGSMQIQGSAQIGPNVTSAPATNNFPKGEKESQPENLSSSRNSEQDFHVNKFIAALSEYSNESQTNATRIALNIKELKIPKSFHSECILRAMKQSIYKTEADRENTSKLLLQLVPTTFEAWSLLSAFKSIFEQLNGLEVEIPRVKSLIAGFLSRAVYDGILSLEEVSSILYGGKHHPLFLLFLQKVEKSAGQVWLCDKFTASKINLMEMLPEVDRTKERLAIALKDRCLGFLDPMLTIEPDLWAQMKDCDPSPAAVYRWIKDNVDQTIQVTPTFAHVLIACLLRYIHNAAQEKASATSATNVANTITGEQQKDSDTEGSQSNKSSPTTSSSQSTIDIEKDLLAKYQQVLQAILKDKKMQLATLYALQLFYYKLDFPKGALLRWFHMLYDMNIVDDDVFFIWKEEINDEFPGKGQALFQVNTWLNWLAEAESEEEEEEEEV